MRTIDIRPQVMSTVREVHICEGQFVRAGELLFPIMMTTLAAMMGEIPIAAGPGCRRRAASAAAPCRRRRASFSQVITLYVTPVLYLTLDRSSGKGAVTTTDFALEATTAL